MWHWSKLSSSRWTDAWEERFYGNPASVIHELKGGKTVRVEVYCDSEEEARAIQEQFGGSVRKLTHEELAPPPPKPPPPLKIRDRLVITQETEPAAWEDLARQFPGRVLVRVPAEMAFGTGDHPTTATCLRLLVDVTRPWPTAGWSLLDLGCGSGVLAIAGRLLGARKCLGLDYDPNAVAVARGNCERNKVDQVTIEEADVCQWESDEKWDFVVANLFAGVLAQALPAMARAIAPEGRLVLSGILREQCQDALAAAEGAGFRLKDLRPRGKWCTALFAVAP